MKPGQVIIYKFREDVDILKLLDETLGEDCRIDRRADEDVRFFSVGDDLAIYMKDRTLKWSPFYRNDFSNSHLGQAVREWRDSGYLHK